MADEEQENLEVEAEELAEVAAGEAELEPETFDMSPGCEYSLNIQERSVTSVIEMDRNAEGDDGEHEETLAKMEAWFDLYHQVFTYTVDDQGLEYVTKDYNVE